MALLQSWQEIKEAIIVQEAVAQSEENVLIPLVPPLSGFLVWKGAEHQAKFGRGTTSVRNEKHP